MVHILLEGFPPLPLLLSVTGGREVVVDHPSAQVSTSSCNTSLDKLAIRVSPLLAGFRYTLWVRHPAVQTEGV